MPDLDSTAAGYLDTLAPVKPVFYAWLDILGDNIRATTAGYDVVVADSGDSELDGTYKGVDPQVVNVGDVTHEEGGSQTLTVSLSGMLLPDADLLDLGVLDVQPGRRAQPLGRDLLDRRRDRTHLAARRLF